MDARCGSRIPIAAERSLKPETTVPYRTSRIALTLNDVSLGMGDRATRSPSGTASAGLAILLITTGIPYSVFSSLLRSMNPAVLGQLPEQEFISGFKLAAFVFAIINTCAIIPSFLRGPEKERLAEMTEAQRTNTRDAV
jgi:hypothetical protein